MAESTEDGKKRFIAHEKLVEELIAFSESSPFVISKVAPGKETPVSTDAPELGAAEPFPMSTLDEPELGAAEPFPMSTLDEPELGAAEPFPMSTVPVFEPMHAPLRTIAAPINHRGMGLAKWFVVAAVVLAVAGGVVGFFLMPRQGNTSIDQVNAVGDYLFALESGNESGASLYWTYGAVPKKYLNVLSYEVFDPRKDSKGNIRVRARITSKLPNGSSVDRLWDFLMFRDSPTGEWKIQDIKPAS